MKLLRMKIDNFCSIEHKEIEFGNKTFVNGANGTGKSTVKKALLWVLGCKDENGKEIADYRPRNADGSEKNSDDISVELTFDEFGRENTLTKVSSKEFTKQGEFKGNKIDYIINGIPKKSTDYKEFVDEIVIDLCCFSARSFLSLDTNGRRKKLIDIFGIDTEELLKEQKYQPVASMLVTGTPDECIKMYREMLKGKRNAGGLERELDSIIAKSEELQRSKKDIDVSAWELAKRQAEEELNRIDSKIDEFKDVSKEHSDMVTELIDLSSSLNEIKTKHYLETADALHETIENISSLRNDLRTLEKEKEMKSSEVSDAESKLDKLDGLLDAERDNYDFVSGLEFDEKAFVCPTCGKGLGEKEKNKAIEDFRIDKQARLLKSAEKIEEITNEMRVILLARSKSEQSVKELEVKISNVSSELKKQDDKYKSIKENRKPLEEFDEYVSVTNRMEELKKRLDRSEKNRQTILDDARQERLVWRCRLKDAESMLAVNEANTDIDNRIEELKGWQKEIAARIANCQKMIDLLIDFRNELARKTEEEINRRFDLVRFRLFEDLTNGEKKEVCTPCIDGVSYDANLNFAHRILAEMDICKAFQEANGIELPMIIDEASSIDPWRLNGFDRQLIIISRSDDKELTIKKED